MDQLLYSDSKCRYYLFDFYHDHCQLLFRSHKSEERNYNIDILFLGASTIHISRYYNGLKIYLHKRNLGDINGHLPISDELFMLTDNSGKSSYIDATAIGVFCNFNDIEGRTLPFPDSNSKLYYWFSIDNIKKRSQNGPFDGERIDLLNSISFEEIDK